MQPSDEHDDIRPTIDYASTQTPQGLTRGSLEFSLPRIGLLAGTRPKFADGTAKLLRHRLSGFTLVATITLTAGLLVSIRSESISLLIIRGFVLLTLAGVCWLLRSGKDVNLQQLRALEVISFSLLILQVSLMGYFRTKTYSDVGEMASAVGAKHYFFGAWAILILAYGIFIPNTWKRAALILLPVACLPYIGFYVISFLGNSGARSFFQDQMTSALPIPLIAVLVAVYGTHIINSVRREAFKARQLGQYRLREKLGEGGMGEVYRAEHRMLKRPCAIKLIRSETEADERAISRFEREVQATANLSHWNTVQVFDYGRTDDGTFYYVMELLPGASLERIC